MRTVYCPPSQAELLGPSLRVPSSPISISNAPRTCLRRNNDHPPATCIPSHTSPSAPSGPLRAPAGQKKWITFGVHADWFTVAVRTGGAGPSGISLLLVDAHSPGITVTRMKLQGNWLAGTAMVNFDDVEVPVDNLIGKENDGFTAIMLNFNHERLVICTQVQCGWRAGADGRAGGCVGGPAGRQVQVQIGRGPTQGLSLSNFASLTSPCPPPPAQCNRSARMCIEEAVRFARQRRTFGKRLIDHQAAHPPRTHGAQDPARASTRSSRRRCLLIVHLPHAAAFAPWLSPWHSGPAGDPP